MGNTSSCLQPCGGRDRENGSNSPATRSCCCRSPRFVLFTRNTTLASYEQEKEDNRETIRALVDTTLESYEPEPHGQEQEDTRSSWENIGPLPLLNTEQDEPDLSQSKTTPDLPTEITSKSSHDEKPNTSETEPNRGMGSIFMKIFDMGNEDTQKDRVETVADLVARVRQAVNKEENLDDAKARGSSNNFSDILQTLEQYKKLIDAVAEKYVGDIDLSKLSAVAVYYYLEHEDERKHPSWKCRKHRFLPGVDFDRVYEINDALDLALLAYADEEVEIQNGLDQHVNMPSELLYADLTSEPGKPSNIIAVPRNQSSSSMLEVLMCVRGTKTISDVITDVLCDAADYRGGKAHSFILTSGMYLAEKHTKLLEHLLNISGKKKLKLRLIGHSLGAGAASIAGMEFNDNPKFEVEVIGFGCPALLSKDLAENAKYITTIINDSDVIPRTSGDTAANLLMDIMQLDWFDYAMRDIDEAMQELNRLQPMLFNKDLLGNIREKIKPMVEEHSKTMRIESPRERANVVLFPPGVCVHLYRDGLGLSGNIVPNTFFSEIDFSRRLIADHVFHSGYQQSLLELVRQQKGDHHFRFDTNKTVVDGTAGSDKTAEKDK